MYDDVYLIKGIFEELEVAIMTAEDIEILGKLLDDKLAQKVTSMIDRVKASPVYTHPNAWAVHLSNQINLFEELIGDKARKYTYHLTVRSNDYLNVVSKLNIETAYEVFESDLALGKKILGDLLENRRYWISELDPRQKKDYELFEVLVAQMANRAATTHHVLTKTGMDIKVNNELPKRVRDNRPQFYVQNEKVRKTGVGILISKETDMRIILHGFNYRDRVKKEGASKSQWRRI